MVGRVKVRIATHHGIIDNYPVWQEKIHSILINIAHVLVAVSERTRLQAIQRGSSFNHIKNGIVPISSEGKAELRKEAGVGDDELYLLSVGRLVYQKAHSILVQAMPKVLKKFPNARLGICGEGILRIDLEAQIALLGLSE